MPYCQPTAARVRALSRGLTTLVLCLALAWGPAPAVTFDPGALASYARQHYGAKAGRAVESWQAMLAQAAGLDEQEKLRMANGFWNNALIGGEDISIWGQVDYWATPLQSLAKGSGDCEDYVIGKYFSLLYLGVAPEKLRFVYVRAQIGSQSIAHMVLGYYPQPQAEPLVLDSLVDRIQPAHNRPDLTPVFSFNAQGVYMPGGKRSSVEGIGRWRDLLSRMRAEGFQP
ncbi:transglutaminase-like cysteine peptidase [Castellaniella sp.]|jgi:predicted transglutaminase-like cysteine proteinase|uniref:transglutaminase-like cysteine peptidase n=1 Tax=Castellaniella sp. TaxID=1955812 RepID=UPI002D7ECB1C|nr:transglutaminase-like cysteine peptidase [Castellaniella sp.]HET8702695.1 transglutaminase-like cysteine peptidase [Castellaniella sp.]